MATHKNCVLAAPIDPRVFGTLTDTAEFERAPSTPSTTDAELSDDRVADPAPFDDAEARKSCAAELLQAQFHRSEKRKRAVRSRVRGQPSSPASPLQPWRRRPRAAELFRFFVRWKRIEHKNNTSQTQVPRPSIDALLTDFHNLTGPLQYYWTHMHELWLLYERQQLALRSPIKTAAEYRSRTRELAQSFYYLDGPAQKLLVDDWIVERNARQRERHAEQLETCLARKTLAKIKADVLALVANIDYVLRESRLPRQWPATFVGV
jgi:hypothetical protein